MRSAVLAAIAAAVIAVGCGRKPTEEPVLCNRVVILAVTTQDDAVMTLMETTDERKLRMLRPNSYGNVGDQFTFCD